MTFAAVLTAICLLICMNVLAETWRYLRLDLRLRSWWHDELEPVDRTFYRWLGRAGYVAVMLIMWIGGM